MSTSDEAVRSITGELFIALRDLPVENNIPLCFERTLRDMGVGEAFEAGQILREQTDGIATLRNNELITVREGMELWDAALAKVLRGGKP